MVITAAESGTFWRPAIDLVRAHAPDLLDDLRAAYEQPDGNIDPIANIALWITHDLGHAFHEECKKQNAKSRMNLCPATCDL
jgi:hypothetical protein